MGVSERSNPPNVGSRVWMVQSVEVPCTLGCMFGSTELRDETKVRKSVCGVSDLGAAVSGCARGRGGRLRVGLLDVCRPTLAVCCIQRTWAGSPSTRGGRRASVRGGDLYLTGAANGPGWPVRNAFQAKFAGTNDGRWGNGDCILARFRRTTGAQRGAATDADTPRR